MVEETSASLHRMLLIEYRYQSVLRTARYYVGPNLETTLKDGRELIEDAGQVGLGVRAADIRVHRALADNRRIAILVTVLALVTFLVAVSLLVRAFWVGTPTFVLGALALGTVCHSAIRQILRVRRDNRVLASLPVIVRVLPPEEAAAAMIGRLC